MRARHLTAVPLLFVIVIIFVQNYEYKLDWNMLMRLNKGPASTEPAKRRKQQSDKKFSETLIRDQW
jgi:hypothetical protein